MQSLSQKNTDYFGKEQNFISLPGLLFVIAIHGALFYGLWKHRLIPPPEHMVTLFADFIAASVPETAPKKAPEPPPAKLQPIKKPEPKPKQPRLVANVPALPKEESVAPMPEPEPLLTPEVDLTPEPEVVTPPAQMQAGPVTLTSELSVSCPTLNAPAYPPISRRMGEEGKLVLRVELDENGRVNTAEVVDSSGYSRLDEAALTAVKTWQCRPPLRDGQPVRAIALQPFNFVLQGN
ncbi:MAG: energy transducer TonB [Nitrosomonas sp.]|nr:energy transducer TonB [Nitrosomonas sp.]MDP1950880.1 energy transducer TonB [Nitrosomonas sp.]